MKKFVKLLLIIFLILIIMLIIAAAIMAVAASAGASLTVAGATFTSPGLLGTLAGAASAFTSFIGAIPLIGALTTLSVPMLAGIAVAVFLVVDIGFRNSKAVKAAGNAFTNALSSAARSIKHGTKKVLGIADVSTRRTVRLGVILLVGFLGYQLLRPYSAKKRSTTSKRKV